MQFTKPSKIRKIIEILDRNIINRYAKQVNHSVVLKRECNDKRLNCNLRIKLTLIDSLRRSNGSKHLEKLVFFFN